MNVIKYEIVKNNNNSSYHLKFNGVKSLVNTFITIFIKYFVTYKMDKIKMNLVTIVSIIFSDFV